MNSRKRIFAFAVLLSFIGAGLAIAPVVWAAGLVPCGGPGEPECNACHLFVLARNILDLVLTKIVPVVAVLFIIYGGFVLLTAGGSQERVKNGRKIIFNAVIGLAITYGAFVIVGTVLGALSSRAGASFNFERGRIIIQCEVPPAPERPAEARRCPDSVNRYNNPDEGCSGCKTITSVVEVKSGVGGILLEPLVAPLVNEGLEKLATTLRQQGIRWRVTEAYCPVVSHQDKDHYNGHAVDVVLIGATEEKLKKFCVATKEAGFSILNEYTAFGTLIEPECPSRTITQTTTGQHFHLER